MTHRTLLLTMLTVVSCAAAVGGAERVPVVREIFVPYEDLNVLIEAQPQRVFLSREEYDDLLRRARRSPQAQSPHKLLLVAANYEAVIAGERALISGSLDFEVLAPGLHTHRVHLAGVGVQQALLDGQAAPLARSEEGEGAIDVFMEGQGRHTLQLKLVAPIETNAAQQRLAFHLPTPPATQLKLRVAGDVELRSGAGVLSRQVDRDLNETRFELVPGRGPLELVLSLNNRHLREQSVVTARSVVVDEVTQSYERLHARFSLHVLQGAIDRLRFTVPREFEITSIESPLISRWAIRSEGEQAVLEVRLRDAVTDGIVLNVLATKNQGGNGDWTMPRLEPLDVHSHVAMLGLLLEEQLQVARIGADGLIPIDTDILRNALPESVFRREPGVPPVRPIAAHYAPQNAFELNARFEKPPSQPDVDLHVLLTVDETAHHLRGGVNLKARVEKQFDVDVALGSEWDVQRVVAADGKPLMYDLLPADEQLPDRIHVRLPSGVAPGQTTSFFVEATRSPADWLSEWREQLIEFPQIHVLGAGNQHGAIAVQASQDLRVQPEALDGLTVLNESNSQFGPQLSSAKLAFRYQRPDYSATITVIRRQPTITARVFNFLRLEPEGLFAHYELLFDIDNAGTRRLAFQLPSSTPQDVAIRGLDGVRVRQYQAEEDGSQRRWTVHLSERHRDQVRLAVDFRQQVGEQLNGFVLPLARAEGVDHQTGIVAVEGKADFDTALDTDGRRVDVGELVDAEYQVGRRLLGVFGLDNRGGEVRVDVARRLGHPMPAAIVQRCELITMVSANGVAQTAARYLLRTKTSYLQVQLPDRAELWSARVDGIPAAPQRDGDGLLLNFPASSDEKLRDLQVVFQTPNPVSAFVSDIQAAAPVLMLPAGSGGEETVRVPMADVVWRLILPAGQQVVRTQGTVFTDPKSGVSPMARLARIAFRMAGGIGSPFLLSARSPTTGSLAESTREPAVAAAGDAAAPAFSDETTGFEALTGEPNTRSEKLSESLRAANQQAGGLGGKKITPGRGKAYWALEGVRSLPIELDQTGEQVTFHSMGTAPLVAATLVDRARLEFLSWAIALLVFLLGLGIAGRRHTLQVYYVIATMAVFLLLPLLVGSFSEIDLGNTFDRPFFAAALLIFVYVLVALLRKWRNLISGRVASWGSAAAATLLITTLLPSVGYGQVTVSDIDDILSLVQPDPVSLPDDAIIIPYDASVEDGVAEADKVLVPYRKYLQLWTLANPDEAAGQLRPPAAFATAGGSYRTTLAESEELLVEGVLQIDVFVDEDVEVMLPLQGAVLTKALLDGQPAKIRVVAPRAPTSEPNSQASVRLPPGRPESMLVIYTSGRGRKQFEFSLRVRLQRRGGWRTAAARLPTAAATQLSIEVPKAGTELHVRGISDRTTFESQQDNETIETAVRRDGQFSLRWRPAISIGQVDQTLTATSAAVVDIQEDALRANWRLQFALRQSQRESFTLLVPSDYLIEEVNGDNVRGWRSVTELDRQRVEVTLLRPATNSEALTIKLSRAITIGVQPTRFTVPKVSVPDAVQHRGLLLIRRSPLTNLQSERVEGLSRAEMDDAAAAEVVSSTVADSPLGIRNHQAFRFASEEFSLHFAARSYDDLPGVDVQALLKLAKADATFEARLNFAAKRRPVHHAQMILPEGLQLVDVQAPGEFEWSLAERGARQVLTMFYKTGNQGKFSLLIRGRLPSNEEMSEIPLPHLEVLDVEQQTGHLVVQVDPSFDVRAEQLQGCQPVLLEKVHDWLNSEQRRWARLALRYRTPKYSGVIRTTRRQPQVSHFTITNIRVTSRAVETTLFLRFQIREAGIREITFRVPAWMSAARISVPHLKQQTVEPLTENPDFVRVRLELQDEVIGQLIVVVERDRALEQGPIETVLPLVETGRPEMRFVVLENAGRDEVVVSETAEISELKRQRAEWRELAKVLGSTITQAFIVRDAAIAPQFTINTRQRRSVQTADARIRLAETLLLCDAQGAFRGRQSYRIDNKTEQYLELQLPPDAELWTAAVAGQPVKPATVAGAGAGRQVRIPLIKTAQGDLDYEVLIKYGGQLRTIRGLDRFSFPFIRTVNINVEESQVRLRLPQSHRWFDFNGTTQRVVSRGELEAGLLSYQTRQIESLQQFLASGDVDKFTKVRAANNLKKAVKAAANLEGYLVDRYRKNNETLQREILSNTAARQEAERQILSSQSEVERFDDSFNRRKLRSLGMQQGVRQSNNAVIELGNNFAAPDGEQTAGNDRGVRFERDWLAGHQLSNDGIEKYAENSRLTTPSAENKSAAKEKEATRQLWDLTLAPPDSRPKQAATPRPREEGARGEGLGRQLWRYQQKLQESRAPEAQSDPMSMMGVDVEVEEDDEATGWEALGAGGRTAGERRAAASQPRHDLGLSSLDVEFAERGKEFLFTTPRGEVVITARAVRTTHVDRFRQLLTILAVAAGVYLLWRVARWLNRSLSRRARGIALVLAGCASLLGFFPVLGMLSLVAGIATYYAANTELPAMRGSTD